jgi:prefoldin subunit 5
MPTFYSPPDVIVPLKYKVLVEMVWKEALGRKHFELKNLKKTLKEIENAQSHIRECLSRIKQELP